jgi:hypothetical protein
MTDQLRYNEDKPKLSDIFASARAVSELAELDGVDYLQVEEQHWLTCAVTEIARFLDRGPTGSLQYPILAVLLELERDLAPLFKFQPPANRNVVALLGSFPQSFRELCKVYEYGATKYERGNYRKGAPLTSYLDSALRHLLAYGSGETKDRESACHHLAHALWNLWIALDLPAVRDDRLPSVIDWYDAKFPSARIEGDDDDFDY